MRLLSLGMLLNFSNSSERLLRLFRLYEVKGAATDGAFFARLKAALEIVGICEMHSLSLHRHAARKR
jgi:hypothetical protein